MPDVTSLLKLAVDDPSICDVPPPEGSWKGELKKIIYRTKNKAGEPLVDKNGEAFGTVSLLIVPQEPGADIPKSEAKRYMESGPNGVIARREFFFRSPRDLAKVRDLFDQLGVSHTGRTWEALATEFSGGIPCTFDLEHDTRDNDTYYLAKNVDAA